MSKPPARSKKLPKVVSEQDKSVTEIPSENVEILNEALGVDIAKVAPSKFWLLPPLPAQANRRAHIVLQRCFRTMWKRGFPDLPPRVINTIDQQIAHRQKLEILTTEESERRKNRGQIFAFIASIVGIVGALVAGYLGVPWGIGITIAVISVGGPNAATVIARWIDKN